MGGGEQVDEEAEGSGDGFGELAVEGEGDVGPAALADVAVMRPPRWGSWAGVTGPPGSCVSVRAV